MDFAARVADGRNVIDEDSKVVRVVTHCKDKSLAVQSAKDETDVNKIVARFDKTGVMPYDLREAMYTDVSEVGSFQEATERIAKYKEYFDTLPAKVREKFNHNPSEFLDYVSDAGNEASMIELGLIPPKDEKPEVAAPAA